jgi:hypothetical protein
VGPDGVGPDGVGPDEVGPDEVGIHKTGKTNAISILNIGNDDMVNVDDI